MRALIARDLADAGLAGLSADRRFATAYNAALQAANMVSVRWVSDHEQGRTAPGVARKPKFVLGKPVHNYADYFETCRRKRNTIQRCDGDGSKGDPHPASQFYGAVEDWITNNLPSLKK